MFETAQEDFWAGDFGTEYVGRNSGATSIPARIALFAKILARAPDVGSVYEAGANVGHNLVALRHLLSDAAFYATEINKKAFDELAALSFVKASRGSFLESPPVPADLAFTCGVLIHINPDRLKDAYRHLYESARKYVCVVEYYNPSPVSVEYRGHSNRLFKRDFAGELMDRYPLTLIDYGFVYRRGRFPLDDVTWFLLEK